MNIRITRHAKQRMLQRRIHEDEVSDTLEAPDDILPGDGGEAIAIRRYPFHEVRVVYEENDTNEVVVFTVMRTKIRR